MTPLIQRAWHAVGMARSAEALMLGAGLALLTLAAALVSGAPLDGATLALACGAGGLFGVSWFVDLKPRMAQVARQVDHGLRLGGSLLSAFEAEQKGLEGDVARLLSQRVRERVRVAQAVKAALPASLPFLAAPLLGASAFFAVRSSAPQPPDPGAWIAPALIEGAGRLGAAKQAGHDALGAGRLQAEQVTNLAALEGQAHALAADCRSAELTPGQVQRVANDLQRLLGKVERELDVMQNELRREHGVRRALEESAAHLDSALAGLSDLGVRPERQDRSGGPAGADGGPRPAGDDRGAGAAKGGGAAGEADGVSEGGGDAPSENARDKQGAGLASDGTQGTMSGQSPRARGSGRETASSGGAREPHGSSAHRWWPERHAGLVLAWIEARRGAALEDDSDSPRGEQQDRENQDQED